MGKGKLVEELRQKVRKKLECISAQSGEITQRLAEIQTKVENINQEAVEAANTLLKEKNKDRVKSHYTTVMQTLEESYNVLFLLNGSLPDDGGEDSSDSETESDMTTDSAAATSTPLRAPDQPKAKIVSSFLSEISEPSASQSQTAHESSLLLQERSLTHTKEGKKKADQAYDPGDPTLSISSLHLDQELANLGKTDDSSVVIVEKDDHYKPPVPRETRESDPPAASIEMVESVVKTNPGAESTRVRQSEACGASVGSRKSQNSDKPVHEPELQDTHVHKKYGPRSASPRSHTSRGSDHPRPGSTRSVSSKGSNNGRPRSLKSKQSKSSGRRSTAARSQTQEENAQEEDLDSPVAIPAQVVAPDKGYDVTIEVVETPWLLWVQPFNEELDDLIDNMSVYHGKLRDPDRGSKLPCPPRVGMYVSSLYSASPNWYRALITHIYKLTDEPTHEVSMVRVFYIDFGNSEDRNVEHLRPLPRRFTKLPANAIPCALAEVAPSSKDNKWDRSASLGIVMALQTNESLCMKHAVFTYEPNPEQWFVNVYVPQSAPSLSDRPGAIREMESVSEHLLEQKLARKMDNHDLAQLIRKKGLKFNITCGPRYSIAESLELLELIDIQSPKAPLTESRQAERQYGRMSEVRRMSRTKAKKDKATTSVEEPVREKGHTSQMASGGDKGKESTGLRLSSPKGLKEKVFPKRLPDQCGDRRQEGAVGPSSPGHQSPKKQSKTSVKSEQEWKNAGKKWKEKKKPDGNEDEDGAKWDSNKDSERPTSDHQHVGIPPAEIKTTPYGHLEFMMAHIDSPQCFFIHVISAEGHQTYEQLKKDLEAYYSNNNALITMQKYFRSSELEVRDACVARYAEDNLFYRAEIISKDRSGSSPESVKVRYVDYGNTDWVPLDAVYPIQPRLQTVPAQAVCCSLSKIEPIKKKDSVSETAKNTGWLMPAIRWFKENTGFEDTMTAMVEMEEIPMNSTESPLELVVLQGETLINLELVRLGWATAMDLPDLSKLSCESRKGPEVSPNPSPPEAADSGMEDWQPMEEDYLSMRNSYQVDTDDAGVAITGYKQVGDKKICRYFAKGLRCWMGANCLYEHVKPKPGEITDKVATVVMFDQENLVPLPAVDTWVVVEVISVLDPGHVYVCFPYGPGPVQDLQDVSNNTEFTSTCEQLCQMMTSFYDENPFAYQDLTLYAIGEIVAVRYMEDCTWNRCKVTDIDPDDGRVQVFFLDFGNSIWVKERNVKKIDSRFLHVPFQAVECFLPVKPVGDSWSSEAKHEFANFVDGKLLIGRVYEKTPTGTLSIDLYDTTEDEVNVAQYVKSQGYARVCPIPPPVQHQDQQHRVFMVPG